MNDENKKFAFEQTIKLMVPLMTKSSDSTPATVFDRHFEEIYTLVISKMAEKEL
ncbi:MULTISPECIES: hypothetical protein [Pantoea]|jgi:hypothetical protein|uniref:hypothetical protein n=1 Tax=Pantoea TaxID=53335 RepID=UPI001314A916|nr:MULTISPECIES: hypothetical protein [Pantoea]MBZ6385521.1 hypothetical protein [Pantoea piersonii]MBZ6398935.1 hypothetical protein [Pantoea piersonii]MBZ6407567.1 hypothetical protein [Pantoea piersonii]MBZ6425482.1 hypothetical protein [Pantoea piersonii]NYB00995.1 hypothetical protein [Pantoea piersonii]